MDANLKSPESIDEEIFSAQNDSANIPAKIDIKRISILHESLSTSMSANFICASLAFLSLYMTNHDPRVLGWYLATIIVSLVRFVLPRFYMTHTKNPHTQLTIFIIGVILTASLWGYIDSYLLPQDNLVNQMIIIVAVAGITAGGVQTLQPSFLACALSSVIILLPLCIWIFLQHSFPHLILGIAMVTYLVCMLVIAYRGNRMLIQILTLHYENSALIDNLSIANTKLHEYAMTTEANEKMFRNILENAPIGMLIMSPEGKCLQANFALSEMIGYSQAELKKLSTQDIIYPDDLAKDLEAKSRLIEGKLTYAQVEKRYIHKNGQIIWSIANVSLINDSKNEPLYFIVQILDISERKRNEIKMLELNERTASTLTELKQRDIEMGYIKKMTDMLQICQDSSEAYSVIAKAAQDLFPNLSGGFIVYDHVELNMKTAQQWGSQQILLPHFHIDDCWGLRSGSTYVINNIKKDLACQHFDSTSYGGSLCLPLISPNGIIGMLFLNAPAGIIITENHKQLAITLSEIIKLFLANIQLRESLQDLSVHDPLTGLFNRRYLDETLNREMQVVLREKGKLCVAMLDIDYFKGFNDTNGHEAGDVILKFIGKILKESFRGSDLACRFGGEEFIIVLLNSDLKSSLARMQILSEKIKKTHVPFKNTTLSQITVSIGLAEAPTQGTTPQEIIRVADEALYKAKAAGRDRIEIYEKKPIGKIVKSS